MSFENAEPPMTYRIVYARLKAKADGKQVATVLPFQPNFVENNAYPGTWMYMYIMHCRVVQSVSRRSSCGSWDSASNSGKPAFK
jgi:hypothetical protein